MIPSNWRDNSIPGMFPDMDMYPEEVRGEKTIIRFDTVKYYPPK
jgi:hypothetical protein